MKLLRERKGLDAEAFVFTGDGSTDSNILSWLCKRFDGKERFLWFPESPLKSRSKATGLSALRALTLLIGQYQQTRLLLLIDREHLQPGVDESAQFREYLEDRLRVEVETIAPLV